MMTILAVVALLLLSPIACRIFLVAHGFLQLQIVLFTAIACRGITGRQGRVSPVRKKRLFVLPAIEAFLDGAMWAMLVAVLLQAALGEYYWWPTKIAGLAAILRTKRTFLAESIGGLAPPDPAAIICQFQQNPQCAMVRPTSQALKALDGGFTVGFLVAYSLFVTAEVPRAPMYWALALGLVGFVLLSIFWAVLAVRRFPGS